MLVRIKSSSLNKLNNCKHYSKEFKGKSHSVFCSVECYRTNNSTTRPTVIELLQAFIKYKNFIQIGKHFNVSDRNIRKWFLLYKLPTDKKEIYEVIKQLQNLMPDAENNL